MKALLICPAKRPGVAALGEFLPLSNVPILGRSLVECWIDHLVRQGASEVLILATDRPEQVRRLVGSGARWGVSLRVLPETGELTVEEARRKHQAGDLVPWLPAPHDVVLLDHLPNDPVHPLFSSYAGWLETVMTHMHLAARADRVGCHEIRPGVWVGMHSRISPRATLLAPCWIGDNCSIEAESTVGPFAIVESKSIIERGAIVCRSVVGPETLAGEFTEIHESIAWGNLLIHTRLNSCVRISETFLLASLVRPRPDVAPASVPARIAAMVALLLLLPFAVSAWMRARLRGQPAMRRLLAVRPRVSDSIGVAQETVVYREFTCAVGWVRRWPQLWNIIRGEFSWIGNRPLTPRKAENLSSEFERLWLAAPIGLISLADAEGCGQSLGYDARAHASYYAVQSSVRLDLSIFIRAMLLFVLGVPWRRMQEQYTRILQLAAAPRRAN